MILLVFFSPAHSMFIMTYSSHVNVNASHDCSDSDILPRSHDSTCSLHEKSSVFVSVP